MVGAGRAGALGRGDLAASILNHTVSSSLSPRALSPLNAVDS